MDPSRGREEPTAADRTFIILNPAAGRDDPDRLCRRIRRAFERHAAPFDLAVTERPGHATALAGHAARCGYRAVAVVGGDGTLAEVATGLAGTKTPLAILPRGTGNQVASNLHIPSALDHAVDVALHGVPTPMDLGRLESRCFALGAGAGFDAAVMAAATRKLKKRLGVGAYIVAALKEAIHARPVRFHLVADGNELECDAVWVLVANAGALFTPRLRISLSLVPSPEAAWRDGKFDILIVAARNLIGFADVLWRVFRHRVSGNARLVHFQARSVRITADPAVPVQVDGDMAGDTPITASIMRHAIRVLVPRNRVPES